MKGNTLHRAEYITWKGVHYTEESKSTRRGPKL